MISTATPLRTAVETSPVAASQPMNTTSEIVMTAGTNTDEMRSTSF